MRDHRPAAGPGGAVPRAARASWREVMAVMHAAGQPLSQGAAQQ